MDIKTFEEAKAAIEGWLKENKHSIRVMDDKNANFHFDVDFPIGAPTKQYIVNPKGIPGLIAIINPIIISEQHVNLMKNSKPGLRKEFFSRMKDKLLFQDNNYNAQVDKEGIMRKISFTNEFYFDGLTKTRLIKALSINYKSYIYVNLLLNEIFGGKDFTRSDESRMFG